MSSELVKMPTFHLIEQDATSLELDLSPNEYGWLKRIADLNDRDVIYIISTLFKQKMNELRGQTNDAMAHRLYIPDYKDDQSYKS